MVHGRIRIRLARELRPLRRQPGDDVGDFLRRHRPAGHIVTPVRSAQLRPSHNHICSQILITHQSEVGAVDNRTGFLAASAIRSMTGGAVSCVHIGSVPRIAGSLDCIRQEE